MKIFGMAWQSTCAGVKAAPRQHRHAPRRGGLFKIVDGLRDCGYHSAYGNQGRAACLLAALKRPLACRPSRLKALFFWPYERGPY